MKNKDILNVKSWLGNKPQFKVTSFANSSFTSDSGTIYGVRRLKDNVYFQNKDYIASKGVFPSQFRICSFDTDLIHIHMQFITPGLVPEVDKDNIGPVRKFEINQLLFTPSGELKVLI